MRLRYRDIKKIVWMCAAMLFLIGVHVLSVYVFAIHRFTVSYDNVLSEKAQNVVEDYIKTSCLYESSSPEKFVQQLQMQFPFIRKVTCNYAPSGLHVYIKTHVPFVQLPKGEMITVNNCCVPADYFVRTACKDVPMLYCAPIECAKLPEDMFAYLRTIDFTMLKGGKIRWRHNNEIVCELPDQPMRLICNYQKKPTREIVEHCLAIAQELKERPLLAKGFSADVRFADRIVVAKLRNEGV